MPLLGPERVGYKAKYLGGHGAFPKQMDVTLVPYSDYLQIPEMPLHIPYAQLKNIQSLTQEKLSKLRLLLVGILAFAWKKKKLYMVLTYEDEAKIQHDMIFDVDKIEEIQPSLYRNMVEARSRQ